MTETGKQGGGGLSFLKRDSAGCLILASYHPRSSLTWIWSLSVDHRLPPKPLLHIERKGRGQWQHWLRLPFGRTLYLARQDFHQVAGLRARLEAAIERKNAERGRPLTSREKLENLERGLGYKPGTAPWWPAAHPSPESPND
jgi:hypothetical protein